jgi:hypothetical protein
MTETKPPRWFELDPSCYLPLPCSYPWDSRPNSSPLDVEEIATALFVQNGDIAKAAERLRVKPNRLQRTIRKSERLTRLVARLTAPEQERTKHRYGYVI